MILARRDVDRCEKNYANQSNIISVNVLSSFSADKPLDDVEQPNMDVVIHF